MKKLFGIDALFLLLLFPIFTTAQQYRPPVDWYQLKTTHFNIFFPKGYDSVAVQSAQILETNYQPVSKLTGGKLHSFPVIMNTENDLSNGFVSPMNFRMEIELPPIKGKALNPRTGSWLENVLTHELVHAEHFSVVPKLGFSGLIYPFWPDGARAHCTQWL